MDTLVYEDNGVIKMLKIAPIPEGVKLASLHQKQFIILDGDPVPSANFTVTNWKKGLWKEL